MERVIPPAADEAATKVESFPASDPASASKPPMEAQAPGMSTLRALEPKILLGANEATSQFGLLGKFGDDDVGIDLTGCNTISLFGVQGFGKSYTLGVIAEMASQAMGGINRLPSPLATVIFHYHKSDAYPPEFATAMQPNGKQREVERLLAEYQARPEGINDLVILTPAGKVEQRRREFPGIEVRPILFSSRELGTESWKFLLGLHGNDAMYVRQMVAIMRKHRENLTLEALRQEIAHTDLPPNLRRLSEDRIRLAEPYIADEANLREVLRPGRTVIVDLRDEWIEKEEALGLFVVMMRTFALARFEDREFNKLVIFDEAHKYIAVPELVGQLVEVIREMRHLGTSIVIASQDPRSVPREVIELSSIALLHRMTSPDWFKHLRNAIVALNHIPEEQLATLSPGEAFAWAQRCTDERLTRKPHKLKIRPRMSHHGGATKRAIDDGTLR